VFNPKDLTRAQILPAASKEEFAEAEQGLASILEMAEALIRDVPEQEWDRVPADLATNVDHYLYGAMQKTE